MGDSEGYGSRKNRSRSRRRRQDSSVSSLSSRLDPDFDPRLYHKNQFFYDKNVELQQQQPNPNDSDQELDPMTMEFDTLVGCLHPTFILDYLKKILQFLNSKSNELCFPNIAQYKETFLVKIANDNQRLMCAVFNEPCREVGDQILRVIEDNRNVYRWIHMHESGNINKNVLVYKKMFYNEKKTNISNDVFKRPGYAPTPIAPRFEDPGLKPGLNQQQIASKSAKTQLTPMPSSLKITFLNSTMKFLMQDNQLNLEYPQMSVEHAEYFDSVFRQHDSQTDIGFGYESLYAPLYKQLKKIANVYEFKVIRDVVGDDIVRMKFRKIPKVQARDVKHTEKSYQQTQPIARQTPPTDSFKEPSAPRYNYKYLSKLRLVESLPECFVDDSLYMIMEFIDDEKRASLEFERLTADESSFLQLILNISRHISEYANLFSADTVVTFKKIFRVLKYETQQKKRWRLNVNVGRLDRNKLGNVVYEKIPLMDTKNNLSCQKPLLRESRSATTTDSSRSRDDSKDSSIPDIAQRLMELSTKDVSQMSTHTSTSTTTTTRDFSSTSLDNNIPDISKRLMEISTRDVTPTSSDHSGDNMGLGSTKCNNSREPRTKSLGKDNSRADRSLSRGRKRVNSKERRQTSKYAITFQSAGEETIDTMSLSTSAAGDSCQTDVKVTRQFGLGRKQRLMDDLSTPVEIDKAKRMMEQMGWDGGPLGARGEGITEPIMPALHLAPGAGLGHIKPQSHSTTEFRLKFLTSLLTFITSTETEASISFQQALTKREIRFLTPTVKSINKRKPLGLKLEEMEILNRILDAMMCQPTLLIECEVANGNREIRVYKIGGDPSKIKTGNRKKGLANISSTPTSIPILQHIQDEDADIITTEQVLNTDIGIHCSSQKGHKRIAEKVTFLMRINEFLQLPEEKRDYICDFILNTKQREYIHQVITIINNRDHKHKFGTLVENNLYCHIKRNVNNCFMTVIFSGQKFTLHKRYYQKRFTNSSSVAAPVSRDEKNTIIYENNTVRRLSDVKLVEKDKNSEKRDENTSGNCKNDDNDYLALSDQDDILLIDDSDLDNLETDSESDKSENKDTDDEYKDLESDCDEIIDISDDSVNAEVLERENETFIVIDVDSGASDCSDERNAEASKLDKTRVSKVDVDKKENRITEKFNNSDEVKMKTGHENCLFEEENDKNSRDINVKPRKIETSTPKRAEYTTRSDLSDGNNLLHEIFTNGESDELQRQENLGFTPKDNIIEDTVSPENIDLPDTSIDELHLTPPLNENEKDKRLKFKEDIIESNKLHKDENMDSANKGSDSKDNIIEDNVSPENIDLPDTSVDELSLTPPIHEYKHITHNNTEDNTDIEDRNDSVDELHSKYDTHDVSREYLTPRDMTENIDEVLNDSYVELEVCENRDQLYRENIEENVEINYELSSSLTPDHMRMSPSIIVYNKTEYRDIKIKETEKSKDVDKNERSEVNNNFGKDEKSYLPAKEQINGECKIVEIDSCKYGENHVLKRAISRDSIDSESPSSSKRSRSDSENSDKMFKKYKNYVSVNITQRDPVEKITIKDAIDIQKLISENILDTRSLPLLECKGLQNGGLIYNCYNEESFIWLKKVILENTYFHIEILDSHGHVCELERYTLKMKLNSYIAEDDEDILNRIELYNTGLKINNWVVIDRKVSESFIVLIVNMDSKSYQYICENNFNLFAGVTRAQFCMIA